MTFGHFVVKNAFRNVRRTALTVVSIGFSLFLLILLRTIIDIFDNPPTGEQSALRLVTQPATSFIEGMPIAYWEKIKAVPHVKMVTPVQFYGGYFKDPKNMFPSLAADPETLFEMFPEQKVRPEALAEFKKERTAAIVGQSLIDRFGWKTGDRVNLQGGLIGVDLEFKIAGTYEPEIKGQDDVFYFRYDYMNEALGNTGTVSMFWVKSDGPDHMAPIMESIDALFRNSPSETKTTTEKSFIVGMISMIGNIKVLFGSIATVVVFTMLLVAASTMAMAIRERVREVAILKSIGYPAKIVLMLFLGEGMFLAFLGGVTGCALAYSLRFLDVRTLTKGFIPNFPIAAETYAMVLAGGVVIGLVSCVVPAFRASAMTITRALRQLG